MSVKTIVMQINYVHNQEKVFFKFSMLSLVQSNQRTIWFGMSNTGLPGIIVLHGELKK